MGALQKTKPTGSPNHARELDFDPQSFVNVGSFLSSQEKRTTTTTSTSTQTTEADEDDLPAPPRPTAFTSKRIILALVAAVMMLFGTSVYSYRETLAWKVERSLLQKKIVQLERIELEASMAGSRVGDRASNSVISSGSEVPSDSAMTGNSCPGSDILDTCWFKVGLGNCAKDALEDPIDRIGSAWDFAWDSTTEVLGAVGDTIANDFREMGQDIHHFGSALLEFFDVPSCFSS